MCVEDNWPVGREFTNICPLNLGSTVSTVAIKELFVCVLLRACVCEAEKEEATLTGARENKQGSDARVWPAAAWWKAEVGFSHGNKSIQQTDGQLRLGRLIDGNNKRWGEFKACLLLMLAAPEYNKQEYLLFRPFVNWECVKMSSVLR